MYAREPKHHKFFEKDYQKNWCSANNGSLEVRLEDKSRVDCVTETHAIEFDFATKWAEAIGQSLYYGFKLEKKPGIVLIVENESKEKKFIKRIESVVENLGISLWYVYPQDMEIIRK